MIFFLYLFAQEFVAIFKFKYVLMINYVNYEGFSAKI